jgi:predicted kinase
LAAGSSVVLDFGFWSRDDRDRYQRPAEDHGAVWRLVYLKAEDAVLRRRLAERNRRSLDDPNALRIGDRHYAEFTTRFDPPAGEGEEIVDQR